MKPLKFKLITVDELRLLPPISALNDLKKDDFYLETSARFVFLWKSIVRRLRFSFVRRKYDFPIFIISINLFINYSQYSITSETKPKHERSIFCIIFLARHDWNSILFNWNWIFTRIRRIQIDYLVENRNRATAKALWSFHKQKKIKCGQISRSTMHSGYPFIHTTIIIDWIRRHMRLLWGIHWVFCFSLRNVYLSMRKPGIPQIC